MQAPHKPKSALAISCCIFSLKVSILAILLFTIMKRVIPEISSTVPVGGLFQRSPSCAHLMLQCARTCIPLGGGAPVSFHHRTYLLDELCASSTTESKPIHPVTWTFIIGLQCTHQPPCTTWHALHSSACERRMDVA